MRKSSALPREPFYRAVKAFRTAARVKKKRELFPGPAPRSAGLNASPLNTVSTLPEFKPVSLSPDGAASSAF